VASDVPADFRGALHQGGNRQATIYRSKAVGEPPLMLAISVFCAVLDALHSLAPGRQVPLDAPATPEAILMAVEAYRSPECPSIKAEKLLVQRSIVAKIQSA